MFSSWWCLGRPLGLVGQRHWTTEKELVEKGAGSSYYMWVFHARRQVEKTSIARACSFTLLNLAYRVCSCSLLFKAPHPHLPLCYYIFFSLVLFIIYSVGFPLFFQFNATGAGVGAGAGAGFFLAGGAHGWVASTAGSWVFWLFGLGVSSSSTPCPWAPNLHMRQRR